MSRFTRACALAVLVLVSAWSSSTAFADPENTIVILVRGSDFKKEGLDSSLQGDLLNMRMALSQQGVPAANFITVANRGWIPNPTTGGVTHAQDFASDGDPNTIYMATGSAVELALLRARALTKNPSKTQVILYFSSHGKVRGSVEEEGRMSLSRDSTGESGNTEIAITRSELEAKIRQHIDPNVQVVTIIDSCGAGTFTHGTATNHTVVAACSFDQTASCNPYGGEFTRNFSEAIANDQKGLPLADLVSQAAAQLKGRSEYLGLSKYRVRPMLAQESGVRLCQREAVGVDVLGLGDVEKIVARIEDPAYRPGDLNGNGQIDDSDVDAMFAFHWESRALSARESFIMDMDGDGDIDAADGKAMILNRGKTLDIRKIRDRARLPREIRQKDAAVR